MIKRRPADERGHADHGWLETWHSFSFASYQDPEHLRFRTLRVLNDDVVAPGRGFDTHLHKDMEIVTYVLFGELEHKDSTGTGSVLRYGDVQRMTAGSGVTHSEVNPSPGEPLRLLQIWILPELLGLEPGYQEMHVPEEEKRGRLRPIAAPGGRDGAMRIHQDVTIFAAILEPGERVTHAPAAGRHAWIQVATGAITVNCVDLDQGDGAAISGEQELVIEGRERAEFLLFDLG